MASWAFLGHVPCGEQSGGRWTRVRPVLTVPNSSRPLRTGSRGRSMRAISPGDTSDSSSPTVPYWRGQTERRYLPRRIRSGVEGRTIPSLVCTSPSSVLTTAASPSVCCDRKQTSNINSDLTRGPDLTMAKPLPENRNLSFQAVGVGDFDPRGAVVSEMMRRTENLTLM